ncbi:mannosyltransferase putative-domain-containing protein [Aspergillus avenaceus]|uniref:Mannosyltransferase putative-domain-containing protein n=1 Tax=Aspergillus avenaceus TaxID=36643 RepID=A0A5N6THQ4_ASPAV|nr:mannosyltransferase putative-domain-containing protein [Aspergillus avenaceus]
MYLPRPFSRMRIVPVAIVLAIFCLYSFSRWQLPHIEQVQLAPNNFGSFTEEQPEVSTKLEGHINFWRQFQPLLANHEPKSEAPLRLDDAPSIRFEQASPDFNPQVLDMLEDDVATMKQAHSGFINEIKEKPPQLHYVPDTKGLVSTAGGEYLPVLVISLRMLRKTGSELPVEVFLADEDEYEDYICDVVLPSLNARCIVLSHVLDAVPKVMDIKKYQFKLFAMMFSSFEEILFLDADAFPLLDPEVLFMNEPFTSKKMVTWPDFWATTISSYYYEISSQTVPSNAIRQSSESGEVMLSKKSHLKTLLLSVYYNFWGPDYYYALLSQGAAGEGDKETFVAAALAVGEPYYQVSEPICAIGHGTKGGLAGSAMVQFDPIEDFALTQKGQWRVHGAKAPAPRAFFIHANFPKFNPATVFDEQAVNPAFADDGSYTRAWTIPQEVIGKFGTDVEKHFWKEILWTGCELEDKFSSWKGRKSICKRVKKYWNAMFVNKKSEKV